MREKNFLNRGQLVRNRKSSSTVFLSPFFGSYYVREVIYFLFLILIIFNGIFVLS